ncbi:hypothetical protein E7T09_00125 [Deinococcus sp. KSM4-11]|uniref:hypothetical protein n=1 Tax=Deinococcus sp. KSM4-11 TaxID=2568654 RepID=UPI0010A2B021|nr:hypothetical protein [Deinococcus sp. KSM4-11]THF87693.1 hypothetical protein E7T09_00125 [Deinococcus sp. KSM4-11]
MRPHRLSALVLPALILAACGQTSVKAPADYRLSGTLAGDWGAAPHLRLALVGTGFPVAVSTNSSIAQNVVANSDGTWAFGFDLPSPPLPNLAGVYQVVAFNDANNDARLTLGETFARNREWLVYSPVSGTIPAVSIPDFLPGESEGLPELKVSAGWNLYDRTQALTATNPHGVQTVTGYDISR